MKTTKELKQHAVNIFSCGLAIGMMFGLAWTLSAQEAKTNSPANKAAGVLLAAQPSADSAKQPQSLPAKSPSTNSPAKKPLPVIKQLSGAELYSMHCARCHPERYPNERTSAQWKTIALHMRVRANLPAEHVRKVLKYLQDNSGY